MDIYDNMRLASYAAAADAFDRSKNVFQSFLPIVEPFLVLPPEEKSISVEHLQTLVDNAFRVNIPRRTLLYLLELLERQGKLKIEGDQIIPAEEQLIESVAGYDGNKRIISNVFSEFQKYLAKKGVDIPVSEIREQVCIWIYDHSCDLAAFVRKGSLLRTPKGPESEENEWPHSDALVQFLLHCREAGSSEYSAFLRLFDGAVQASLLNFSPKRIEEVTGPGLSFSNLILDTNYVLRLMGVQASLENEAALATWNSLRAENARFFVLEQTINEASQSIQKFLNDSAPYEQKTGRYMRNMKIRTTGFSAALQQGMTRTELLEKSKEEKIEQILKEQFSVSVITNFDPELPEEEIKSLISFKNLDWYGTAHASHDLRMIYYCRKRRTRRVKTLQSIQWWVLTDDRRLTYWNQQNCSRFQECIAEVQLSNILWLQTKKANSDGLTNTIVALASKTAVTLAEISQFAQKVDDYRRQNEGKVENLDNLALIFASSSLTADDFRRVVEEPDGCSVVFDGKIAELKAQQAQQANELSNARRAEEQSGQEMSRLRLLHEKQMKMLHVEQTISDLNKELSDIHNAGDQLQDISKFLNTKNADAGRMVALLFGGIFLAVASIIWKLGGNAVFDWLAGSSILAVLVLALISGGVFLAAMELLSIFVITLRYGTPLKPTELFEMYRGRVLARWRRDYVIQKKFQVSFAEGEIDMLLRQIEKRENDCRDDLKVSHEEQDRLKKEIAELQNTENGGT